MSGSQEEVCQDSYHLSPEKRREKVRDYSSSGFQFNIHLQNRQRQQQNKYRKVKQHNKKTNPLERRISKLFDVLGILAMLNNNNRNLFTRFPTICIISKFLLENTPRLFILMDLDGRYEQIDLRRPLTLPGTIFVNSDKIQLWQCKIAHLFVKF